MELSLKSKIVAVVVAAFIGAVILRTFVIEGFIVRGDSMHPAIESGDYVFVNKLAYLFSEPKRGDVIVAIPRELPKKILKRIIGLPGERFQISGGVIMLKNERTDPEGATTIVLDPEEYYALGDNREVSIDSRELGLIDKWDIKGKVFGVFSFSRFSYKSF